MAERFYALKTRRLAFVSDFHGFKGKGKVDLCLINSAPYQEDIWGSGGITPPFLITALYGGGQLQAPTVLTLCKQLPVPI
jgi:hypothetical protein